LWQQGVQAMLGARAEEQAHLQGVLQKPKNYKHQVQDKKCQYKVHHNDVGYTSDDNESRTSTDTPVPSEDLASASSKSKKKHEDENYHLHVDKKMKVGSHAPRKSDH
jgi:hypothetical protein